ncbi:uncharacterized protein APUU_70598A [Aspergillus puulaauensis]|uniref:Uncharacterized protein n=1 Tax=Aspergillus puulaauensis TaxID=1220207 RepID=A0A7R7XY78_9EURO|nr:uncharacterized protein APUU_70598A [Aspergillus puulaauensis]BCS29028.1 hypothetical protein APUU_70598A [Aspergillus puulaauensis]
MDRRRDFMDEGGVNLTPPTHDQQQFWQTSLLLFPSPLPPSRRHKDATPVFIERGPIATKCQSSRLAYYCQTTCILSSAALGVLRMRRARSNHDTGYGRRLLACSADHFEKQDD